MLIKITTILCNVIYEASLANLMKCTKKVRDLNLQSHNWPHPVCELTYEVPTVQCQNRFAVLSDDDDGRPGVEGATNDSSPLSKGTPVPAPRPHARPRRRGSGSSQKSQPPQPMPRNIPRGWQGQKRKTKVSIVGSSLVRGLGPLVNDEKTEACFYTNPGGSIEIIAPTLGDVTHADNDVIVIGAGSINIPKTTCLPSSSGPAHSLMTSSASS